MNKKLLYNRVVDVYKNIYLLDIVRGKKYIAKVHNY